MRRRWWKPPTAVCSKGGRDGAFLFDRQLPEGGNPAGGGGYRGLCQEPGRDLCRRDPGERKERGAVPGAGGDGVCHHPGGRRHPDPGGQRSGGLRAAPDWGQYGPSGLSDPGFPQRVGDPHAGFPAGGPVLRRAADDAGGPGGRTVRRPHRHRLK